MNFQRHARRHASILIAGAVAATLAAAAVNTRVDPWRMIRAPWADPALDPHRDISAVTRTGKAGLVRSRHDWQAAIFGSSRVISTLDPQAPGWRGKPVVNLGMPGAFLHENLAMAEYFIARQPAETLLFGIDPGDLSSPTDTRPMSDFMASPLNPSGALDLELRYIVGLSTFEASLETLGLRARGQAGEYNAHGLRDRPSRGGGGGQGGGGGKNQLDFIRNRFIDDARIAPPTAAVPAADPAKARKLESLMSACRRKNIRLVLFLHPNHVLLQARSADAGQSFVPFEADRRLLAAMVDRANRAAAPGPPVELWDFYSYHRYNRERVRPEPGQAPALVHWRDLEHFTKDIGEGMLSAMMGWPIADPELRGYGAKITAATVDARISALRGDYQQYLREEAAGDLAWKEALVARGLE